MIVQAAVRPVVSATEASIVLRDGTRVLDGVSVDIRAGEVIAIVGPSGSGKTTLLETLAGLRRATSGRIDVGVSGGPLGYVPQDDIVHRDLTLESTVRYAARLRLPSGTPRARGRCHRRSHTGSARPEWPSPPDGRTAQRWAAQAGVDRDRDRRPTGRVLPGRTNGWTRSCRRGCADGRAASTRWNRYCRS